MRPYAKTPVLGKAPHHDGTGRLLADHPEPVDAVVVHEKIDGSQISWWLSDGGDVVVQSRTKVIGEEDRDFAPTALHEHLRSVAANMLPGLTYRGEYLRYHQAIDLGDHAARLQIEAPTVLHDGPPLTMDGYRALVRADSPTLGGPSEGIVIKDATGLVAKIVRDEYAETKHVPKSTRPAAATAVAEIIAEHATSMRYAKAAQRLRDDGRLTGTRSDIGPLMAEVQRDVEEECASAIKDQLWAAYRKDILRGIAAGVREYVDGGAQ